MLIINPPLAIYKHLAAFSFMLAGIFADLLVVRLCLTSAYVFLIVNGLLGSPLWPHLIRPGHLTVDMLIWGFVCLYVHVSSVVRLVLDERHVPLSAPQEALWRMFYRVGGLSRQLFQHYIAAHMQVVQVPKGHVFNVRDCFYITYQGIVTIQIYDTNGKSDRILKTAVDGSGCMFDFKQLGLLQGHSSPMAKHKIVVTAASDCTLFQFKATDIRTIANARLTKGVWQTIFIGILARIAVQRLGDDHVDPVRADPERLDPLFGPLTSSERPNPLLAGSGAALERPLAHVAYCMQRFFTPPWPFSPRLVGLRHNMLTAPVPTQGATETLEQGIDEDDYLLANSKSSSSNGNYRAVV